MESVNGGSLRSVLTILQPNPDSIQVNLLAKKTCYNFLIGLIHNISIGSILLSTSLQKWPGRSESRCVHLWQPQFRKC